MADTVFSRTRRPAEARRTQILAVAEEAFGTGGFRGAALADIATRVGISQPGLLHHFPSKEVLLITLLERRDDESRSHWQTELGGASVAEALVSLCRHNLANPSSLRLFVVTSVEAIEPGHPAHHFFRQRYARVRDSIAGFVRRDQAAGVLPADRDPVLLASEIIAILDGLQIQWLLDPSLDMPAVLTGYLSQLRPNPSAEKPTQPLNT